MWLKNVIVDIAVTAVIVLWALGILPDETRWAIYIYTPFIALLKIAALATGLDRVKQKQSGDPPPTGFFHLLFAINVSMLLYSYFVHLNVIMGIMAALWAVTWVLSVASSRRQA